MPKSSHSLKHDHLVDNLDDTETLTASSSDTETDNRYKPRSASINLVPEDELPYRPKNGYGQRRWANSSRTRFQRPMYNVTIEFARHMQEQGHNIQTLPLQQRLIMKELLDAGRKLKEREASEPAAAAADELSKVGPSAVEAFPGVLPAKKKPLHWNRKEHSVGMRNYFNGLQFRRALYEDGVDDIEGLTAMSTDGLVRMWMQRRDEFHSGRASYQHASTEELGERASDILDGGTENLPEAPTADGPALGAISMAAMYSLQHSKVSIEFNNVEMPAGASTSDTGSGEDSVFAAFNDFPPSLATTQHLGQVGADFSHSTNLDVTRDTTALPTIDSLGLNQAVRANQGRGRRKNGGPDPEKARREALAARVGRYPLSIPGNNKGEPLSMNLKMSAFTIKQKYSINMTKQLLKDYGVLPADPRKLAPHEKLAEHLVREREKLVKSGASLQEPWTQERLVAHVAAQEAKAAIVPATLIDAQSLLNSSLDQSDSTARAKNATGRITKKKRSREAEDLQNVEFAYLSDQPPRKVGKFKKGARAALWKTQIPSTHVETEHGVAFRSQEALDETAFSSNTYSSPALNVHQQLDPTDWNQRSQGSRNDSRQSPQWFNGSQWTYGRDSDHQDDHALSNSHQNEYLPSAQMPASAYTMPPAPGMTSHKTQLLILDDLIDPALLDL